MSTVQKPAWLERTTPTIRAVGWSCAEDVAHEAQTTETTDEDAVDPARLADEREARRAAELDAAHARAELAEVRAAAEESERRARDAGAEAEAAREALAKSASEMDARTREIVGCAERSIVDLALAVAERVVGRELAIDPSIVVSWVREAIAGAELGESAAIYVSSDMVANVPAEAWGDLQGRVAVDHELPPATAEVHDGARVVRCSQPARLSLVASSVASPSARPPVRPSVRPSGRPSIRPPGRDVEREAA